MGRVHFGSEVFNCMAPDLQHGEGVASDGTPAQKREWPVPLANGETRSSFLMTEPAGRVLRCAQYPD